MLVCPSCGRENPEDARFCSACGTEFAPVQAARGGRALPEAVAEFERLEMRIFAARAMGDLGRAMARADDDPREVLERARELLAECDARLFLFEVDEVLTELG